MIRLLCNMVLVAPLGACSFFEGPDWLVGEAASPDRQHVARLWCEDFCDLSDAATLTISASDREIAVEREGREIAEGELPESDRVRRIFAMAEPHHWQLIWRGPARLDVYANCLAADHGEGLPPPARFRGIEITYRRQDISTCPEGQG